MLFYYIYKWTHKKTNKGYVGVSVNPMARAVAHNSEPYRFGNALRKYGRKAFDYEILHYHIDEDEAYEDETWWIAHYDTFNNGYNMTEGGDHPPSTKGIPRTADHNRKNSEANKGKNRGNIPWNKNKPHSEATVAKIREKRAQQTNIGNKRRIVISGVLYESIASAARQLNEHNHVVVYWLDTGKHGAQRL